MEKDRRDSSPEFDVAYINQLFSSQKADSKPETPSPTPNKPEPKPAKEKTKPVYASPAKKRPGKATLLLTAGICLLLGFFLGRLSLPNPEPAPGTSTPSQTLGGMDSVTTGNPGIAVDYASMSTQELANIAVKISSLSYFGSPTASSILTPDTYGVLSRINPVLTELEQRPDAVSVLGSLAKPGTEDYVLYAANALIGYYVNHCGHKLPEDMTSG